jgi:hypothetical protein
MSAIDQIATAMGRRDEVPNPNSLSRSPKAGTCGIAEIAGCNGRTRPSSRLHQVFYEIGHLS